MKIFFYITTFFLLFIHFNQTLFANDSDFDIQYFIQENHTVNNNQKIVTKINLLFKKLVYTQDINFFIKLNTKLEKIDFSNIKDQNKKNIIKYLYNFNWLLLNGVDDNISLKESFNKLQKSTQWSFLEKETFTPVYKCSDLWFLNLDEVKNKFNNIEWNYYSKWEEIHFLMNKFIQFNWEDNIVNCIKSIGLNKSNKKSFKIIFWSKDNIYGTYIYSNENIYTWWEIIKWAVVDSFKVYNYAISKDKNNVYEHHLKREKYDSRTFKQVFSKFFQDKNWVYIHHKKLHTFIAEDSETFEYLGWYYAKDKNYVYNLSPTYWIKLSADPETFKYIWGWFAKDNENIYYRRWAIDDTDYWSFEYLWSYYAKDKNSVFCWNNILENTDRDSFKYISWDLAQDKYSTYNNCKITHTKLDSDEKLKSIVYDISNNKKNITVVIPELPQAYCSVETVFPKLNIAKNTNNNQYSISSFLDYDSKKLSTSQNIYYVNKTDTDLNKITIILDKNRSEDIFCLWIIKVNWSKYDNYDYSGGKLVINLESKLTKNDWINIYLEYNIDIPKKSYDFGTLNYKQLRFADWYPMIPPYNEVTGFINNKPARNGEYFAYDISDFDFTLEYKSQQQLVVAWPSIENKISGNKLHYELRNARNFTWIASPYFHKISKKVWNTVIQSFTFMHHLWESEALLDSSIEAYRLFSDIYTNLDQKVISIVEVDFVEAMEYQNMIALWSPFYDHYNSSNRNLFIPIVVHEIAHQWWYGLVGNNQAITPWLDEWFTMWSEWYFFEKMYPNDYLWWKDFRMNRRNSQVSSSWDINSTIYDFTSYWDYISSTYHKWVYKLEAIRKEIWDDNYFKLLKEYINNSKYKLADWDYFNDLVEKYKK